MPPTLTILQPRVTSFDARTVKPLPKRADAAYLSAEHAAWREAVISKAGYRCEATDRGVRCTKAAPSHRMFADHIVEIKDDGARFDPGNGQCLCGAHHSKKTALARALRLSR